MTEIMDSASPARSCPVAILMAVHRGADPQHFQEALNSLRAQTFADVRLYLYADGPLDALHEQLISKYLMQVPGRDMLIRGERAVGLPTGLNCLIDAALENQDIAYLARMDADDICLPERIAAQVDFMGANPDLALSGTWCIEFTQPGKAAFHKQMPTDQADIPRFMVTRSPLVHPSVIFRRQVFDDGHRYDARLTQMQDYEFWSRLTLQGYLIGNLPKFLIWYRMAPGFYSRRTGFSRAWTEVGMRLRYARRAGLLTPLQLIRLGMFFLVRISPQTIKRLAYARLRN